MGYILARDVVVDFPIYGGMSRSLKKTFIRTATGGVLAKDASDRVVVRALDRVSFELHDGDRVGLVGHNGSGKSTLLRVLTGAYEPVDGTLLIRGRVASMLNIWLGMDHEATGYENIFLRGAIMGLRRKQIDSLIGDIEEFAELGDYVRMPLRTYSSGMAMRLAFAISTSVASDIILMDEWLSAGDPSFTAKAQARLRSMVSNAKILVLASHDAALIKSTCNKIIQLDHGKISSIEVMRPPSSQQPADVAT